MKKYFLFLISLLITVATYSQNAVEWQHYYGGSQMDRLNDAIETSDGGYLFVGSTPSNDSDFVLNKGQNDFAVLKTDSLGNKIWSSCFGGAEDDYGYCAVEGPNGKYYIAGGTWSTEHDVSGNHGMQDAWLICVNSNGVLEWQKCFGGSHDEEFRDIVYHHGKLLLVGRARSMDGDVTGNHDMTSWDVWVVETDTVGTLLKEKCFGGSETENGRAIILINDSVPVILAQSNSNDYDLDTNYGSNDAWIFRLNSLWAFHWKVTLGGSASELMWKAIHTNSSSLMILVGSYSSDGDVIGNHGVDDTWLIELDYYGNLIWSNCFGGSSSDYSYDIAKTADDGYVLCGRASSHDGDVIKYPDYYGSFWVLKLDSTKNIQWSRCFGGSTDERGRSVIPTDDGGFLVAGEKHINYGSTTNSKTMWWIMKLAYFVDVEKQVSSQEQGILMYPNPVTSQLNISWNSAQDIFLKKIEIIDVTGRQMQIQSKKESVGLDHIDVSSLKPGMYFINIYLVNERYQKMFVKY
ncbi:MAG: T9SS type A sorting domain-containing protein [Bacteroidales bacterium]|nr:T9SS type A sorting domain-containing protein [Bacteroidales bacterium]